MFVCEGCSYVGEAIKGEICKIWQHVATGQARVIWVSCWPQQISSYFFTLNSNLTYCTFKKEISWMATNSHNSLWLLFKTKLNLPMDTNTYGTHEILWLRITENTPWQKSDWIFWEKGTLHSAGGAVYGSMLKSDAAVQLCLSSCSQMIKQLF